MLDICVKISDDPRLTTIKLYGDLSYVNKNELIKCWRLHAQKLPLDAPISVDIRGLSSIDDEGDSTLNALRRAGCQILGYVSHVNLNEI